MAKLKQFEFNFEKPTGPLLTPDEIFEQCNEDMLRKILKVEDRRSPL